MDFEIAIANVILAIAFIFVLAKIASRAFTKIGIPGLIGEILLGIMLVSITFDGHTVLDWIITGLDPGVNVKDQDFTENLIYVLSELGVIFLLFMVGLETKVSDLTSVGKAAVIVAIMGVVFPFLVGYMFLSMSGGDLTSSMFLGAAMVATSVGITARVIKDMRLMDVKESRIIIGAAVIDDILGMIVLAIVSGMAGEGGSLDITSIITVSVTSVVFVLLVILAAAKLVPKIYNKVHEKRAEMIRTNPEYIPPGYNMFVIALGFCLIFSYLADIAGLAMIIGAFLAGMIFAEHAWEWKLEEKFESISTFFVSFFFVHVGTEVEINSFINDPGLIVTALVLILLACITKYVGCGLGAKISDRNADMTSVSIIGVGMVPRGEVGIIVASIGKSLGVLSAEWYAIIVMMCIATTIIAPPILSKLYSKKYTPAYAIRDSDRL